MNGSAAADTVMGATRCPWNAVEWRPASRTGLVRPTMGWWGRINSQIDADHAAYIMSLQRLTPEQRLDIAFELTEFSRELFRHGLRDRFPEKTEEEIDRIFLERIDCCHNKNY